MSDLTDERLREIALGPWHRKATQDDVGAMASELQRHRAARGADAERVRGVVRSAVIEFLNETLLWYPEADADETVDAANAIAARVDRLLGAK